MTTNELILAIITLLTTGGGLASFISLFNKDKKNKKLKEEIETLKDVQQDSRMNKIETTLEWIVERMKTIDDKRKIIREVQEKVDNLIGVKKLSNYQIKHLIFNSVEFFKNLVADVYSDDFSCDSKKLLEKSEHLLKNVKKKIEIDKLGIDNPILFLEELEVVVIKPELQNFAIKYHDLRVLKNGVRRNKFKEISLNFISKIVGKSIDHYNNFYAKQRIA